MSPGLALVDYARWHARDALLRAATPLLLVLGIGGIPLALMVQSLGLAELRRPGDAQLMAMRLYEGTLQTSMLLGALVLVSGIIASDREKQFFRFLFSKPVAPWGFYLQQFLVSLALFVVAITLLPIGFGALVAEVPVFGVAKAAAVLGLLFGSLATLCGALVRRDGVLFSVVGLGTALLQELAKADQLPAGLAHAAAVLPPLLRANALRDLWLAGQPAPLYDVVLVTGYAAAMLAAALFLVRRLPLARS